VVVDQRQAALDLAREVGADETVLSDDRAGATIRDLTGGRGAEVVLDFVGVDATMALAAGVARQLGHVTVVGIGGGTLPFNAVAVPFEVSVATTYWGSITELMEVLALARAGHIRAHTSTFPLTDAVEAYDRLAAGRIEGRAVIVPTG
jgi:propanol-preferring alcohol dehydrogenase